MSALKMIRLGILFIYFRFGSKLSGYWLRVHMKFTTAQSYTGHVQQCTVIAHCMGNDSGHDSKGKRSQLFVMHLLPVHITTHSLSIYFLP